MSLVGQKHKRRYRIGDEVKVRLVSASKEECFIDFEIINEKEDQEEKENETQN
jgi:exoribonuclease R